MAKNYMVGNWKMNQNFDQVKGFFNELLPMIEGMDGNFWIAPQLTHHFLASELAQKSKMRIGVQDISAYANGAYTGEVSAFGLKEIGNHFAIIGHSERREYHRESDELINQKVGICLQANMTPILCVGETLEQREAGQTLNIVLNQVEKGLYEINLEKEDDIIIAYEPVWAIGTGKTATPEQAQEVHAAISKKLSELYTSFGNNISILYGGSVKPSNVKELMNQPNINGGLVGGASLKANDFFALCQSI